MNIIKNYIYNTLYQIMLLLVPLITMPYLTRVFTPDQLGINLFAESIVNYFMLLGVLGMQIYANRQVAYVRDNKEKLRKTFWSLFFIQLTTMIISSFFYLLFISFVFVENKELYFVQGINMIALMIDISWLFMGLEDFKKVSLRNIFVKLVGLAGIFIFVKSQNDLLLYIFILTITNVFGMILMWLYIPKSIRKIEVDKKIIKKTLLPLLLLFLPQIASQVYTILSRTMIGILSTDAQVAFYDYSQKIVRMVLALIVSVGTVLMPRVSNMRANGEDDKIKEFVYKAFMFVSYLAIPIAFGLMGVTNNLISWFLDIKYIEVGFLASISSIIIIPVSWANIIGVQYLIAIKEENKYTFSIVVSSVLSFISNLILIPKIGALGAVISLIIAEFTGSTIQLLFVRKEFNILKMLCNTVKYFITSIMMLVIVIFVGNIFENKIIANIVQVIVGGSFYLTVMLIIKDKIQIEIIEKVKTIILHKKI
ncbi:oligosaccharide flippase family protein [uncultured Clostridium sp.]|nr:oligosaccharide flippase family protein [uncultured Clostridium sp.]